MTSWERIEQLLGKSALEHLSRQTVAVVGVGSGGGFVAVSLAMSGVGHFVLIDDDRLETGNVVRHMGDLRDVGRPKVDVVADLIRARNPQAEVTAIQGRVEDHLEALDGVSLVVVGVDGEQIKYVINRVCLTRGLTAIYAGVYERGEGGDVVVIDPRDPASPCYACWADDLREGIDDPAANDLDYGMIGPDGTLEAEPGLWLHVVRVAAAQADLALNALLRGTDAYRRMPANTVILANRPLEIFEGHVTPPYGAEWIDIARDADCLECGQRERLADSGAAEPSEDHLSLDELMSDSGIHYQDEIEENGDR
jgi:molybdopterin/thiamine biosynthesis adenylyltransferase